MGAIRGAVCAENTPQSISDKSVSLIAEIIKKNNLQTDDIDAIFFSATSDLDSVYPAKVVREKFALNNAAFMCFAEMNVSGSLDHCIRVCVFTSKIKQGNCVHCYMGRAKMLREDL